MSDNVYGLPSSAVEKIQCTLGNHARVEKAVIYGSRAKGDFRNGSDIDLTLFGEGLDYPEMMDISMELDDLLLPYMIDLSIFEKLGHVELKEHIERIGQVFYERNRRARLVDA